VFVSVTLGIGKSKLHELSPVIVLHFNLFVSTREAIVEQYDDMLPLGGCAVTFDVVKNGVLTKLRSLLINEHGLQLFSLRSSGLIHHCCRNG